VVKDLTIGWATSLLQQDANFEVTRGDTLGILGGTRLGKSSCCAFLTGLEPPLTGEVTIAGAPLATYMGVAPRASRHVPVWRGCSGR
jgi:ABC-type transporter Mla maintaining outer membrane lipid asymmetry ATPase subunit MlaF